MDYKLFFIKQWTSNQDCCASKLSTCEVQFMLHKTHLCRIRRQEPRLTLQREVQVVMGFHNGNAHDYLPDGVHTRYLLTTFLVACFYKTVPTFVRIGKKRDCTQHAAVSKANYYPTRILFICFLNTMFLISKTVNTFFFKS